MGPGQKGEETEALLFPTEGTAHQGPGLSRYHGDRTIQHYQQAKGRHVEKKLLNI